jgi:hypothetical protein
MPTAIPNPDRAPVREPSVGVAAVWLVLYLLIGALALMTPPASGIADMAMLFSP